METDLDGRRLVWKIKRRGRKNTPPPLVMALFTDSIQILVHFLLLYKNFVEFRIESIYGLHLNLPDLYLSSVCLSVCLSIYPGSFQFYFLILYIQIQISILHPVFYISSNLGIELEFKAFSIHFRVAHKADCGFCLLQENQTCCPIADGALACRYRMPGFH